MGGFRKKPLSALRRCGWRSKHRVVTGCLSSTSIEHAFRSCQGFFMGSDCLPGTYGWRSPKPWSCLQRRRVLRPCQSNARRAPDSMGSDCLSGTYGWRSPKPWSCLQRRRLFRPCQSNVGNPQTHCLRDAMHRKPLSLSFFVDYMIGTLEVRTISPSFAHSCYTCCKVKEKPLPTLVGGEWAFHWICCERLCLLV
jgi:hypothetical protein